MSTSPTAFRVDPAPVEPDVEPPVLDTYRSDSGDQLAVWCSHEQQWHRHGACCTCEDDPCSCPLGQGDGHRGAHCSCPRSPYARTGYVLQEVGPLTAEVEAAHRELSYIRGCRWDSCRQDRAGRLRDAQHPGELPPPTDPLAVAHRIAKGYCDVDRTEGTSFYGGPLMPTTTMVDMPENTPVDLSSSEWDIGEDGPLTLRRWRGSWMRWYETHWAELEADEISAQLYKMLGNAYWAKLIKDKMVAMPWRPTRNTVGEVLSALGGITLLPADVDPPSWLWPPPLQMDGSPVFGSSVVSCKNGLLDIDSQVLHEHDPDWFNTMSIPFDYVEDAPQPERWLRFLHSIWPDDPDSILALQQWFGYVVSGRTDLQKILLIVGPPRSGKGTLARVLQALVGRDNYCGPTLASLSTNFGLQPLVGKSLAVVADARLGGRDTHVVVERLLSISGEDAQTVDRKYRDAWTGRLPTRLMILSNELPHFGDASGAIVTRIIPLTMTRSWLGQEDTTLEAVLAAELPGILNWALGGLTRLDDDGRFTQPADSSDAVVAMVDSASPTSAFVRDCCEVGPGLQVTCARLYAAWRGWCLDNGRDHPGNEAMLGRTLRSVLPGLRTSRPRDPATGMQVRTYYGISLSRDETRPNPLSAKDWTL